MLAMGEWKDLRSVFRAAAAEEEEQAPPFTVLPGAVAGEEDGEPEGPAPRWRASNRRIAIDNVDVLLVRAEEAMAPCQTSADWAAAIEILDEGFELAPDMRGMHGCEERMRRLNANMRHAQAEKQRCEEREATDLEARQLLEARQDQAKKLMKDFEKANAKGRFRGKLAKYAKKTAPTFVALEDDDLDKPGAPLFAVDDVIQVGELRPGEDSVAEGRWFIATVVDYKGEGRGGDSFRLEYRWRNGTYGALRVDPEQEGNERHLVRRRLLPEEAEERAKKQAERKAKEDAARERLEAAGVPADDEAVAKLLDSLDGSSKGPVARTDGKPPGHVGDLFVGIHFVPSEEQASLDATRRAAAEAAEAADNAQTNEELEALQREHRMTLAKVADEEQEMAEKLRERTAMLGTLHVTIDRASLSSISGTDCDPYVEITFDHHGEKTEHKTPVQRQTRKPVWTDDNNYELQLYGSADSTGGAGLSPVESWATMMLRVFDHDRLSEDDYIGGAKVDLVPYIEGSEQPLGGDEDEGDEERLMGQEVKIDLWKLVGRVWLSFKYVKYAPLVGPEPTAEEKAAEAEAAEVAMLMEQFQKVDVDNSGTLDYTEVAELAEVVAEQQGSVAPSRQELEKAFKLMDEDGSGEVEFSEFREFWLSQKSGGGGSSGSVLAKGLFSTMKKKKKKRKNSKDGADAPPVMHGKKVLGTLTVVCVRATIDDTSKKSDPYMEFELFQEGERAERAFSTKPRKMTSAPVWGDDESTFEFTVLEGAKTMTVTMWDYDRFSADDFIGSVDVKLAPFINGDADPLVHEEVELLLKDDKEEGEQTQFMDAFTNQADQAKSRWQKAGGKVATASILKLAATAAADERENPEAEPEPEKPPTECEVMVEKVRQLIYGDKPEEKAELIDPDNPSPRESEEGDADKERAADKAKRCGKRLVWVLLILLGALGLSLRWLFRECKKTPSRARTCAAWAKAKNPYAVRPVDFDVVDEDLLNEDDFAEIQWLDTIEQGHPDGTYFELAGAVGLAKADLLGASDPYAVLYFNDEKIGKTRVKFKTLAPVWNQRFSIPKPDPRTYNTVRIEVYDYDRFSADDFMGQVVLTGKGLTAFPTVYTDLPLEKTVLVEKPYTENPELLGKEQDKEFARWEKDTKREKKQWERHNELVQGELTLRLFDASDVRKWQDPRNLFMSRFERNKLEHAVSARYSSVRPRPMHPAPQYSLELTDYELIEMANSLEVEWIGTRSFEEAQKNKLESGSSEQQLSRAEKKHLDTMFLTRSQRRTLELRVSKTWKRDLPHVQMPLWCVQFSDEALVVLAKRMGIKWNGPRAQPNEKVRMMWAHMDRDASGELDLEELQAGMALSGLDSSDTAVHQIMLKGDEDCDGKISKREFLDLYEGPPPDAAPVATLGPLSPEIFEAFIDPIVQEYMDEMPATGAVVTLVKDGHIFFNKGYGHTGTKGKAKANKAREKEEKAKERAAEAKLRASVDAANRQAEEFVVRGAAALLEGVDVEDREALHDALCDFFAAVDCDGSGWVEALELKQGLEEAGMIDAEDAATALLTRADDDGDGRITLDEFLACFESGEEGETLEEKIAQRKKGAENRDPRLRKVRTLFATIDADGNGTVSADELRTGMERVGLSLTDSAVSGLIGEADANGDGVVTMDEFRQLIIKYFEGGTTENMTPEELARHRRQMRKLKTIEAIFHAMDTDNSGTCDANEMMGGMLRAGLAASKEDVLEILKEGDVEGDGELSLQEFMHCFDGVELEEFTPEEAAAMQKREQLTSLFESMDLDGSGEVSGSELRVGLLKAGIVQSDEEAFAILRRGDTDHDGDLTLGEFIDCFPDLAVKEEQKVIDPVDRLRNIFRDIDDDNTGYVDSQELFTGLVGAGVVVTQDEIQELLIAGDEDGDARLTLEEFLSCFDEVNLESWFDSGADLEAVEKACGLDEEARQARIQAAIRMFETMDEDRSGWVSPQEVITGMAKLSMPGGAEEVRSLLEMADTDGDGKIEPDEFLAWFESRYQEQKKKGPLIGHKWWEGQTDEPELPDPAPLDTKDGLGEVKKGNVETSPDTTLIAVGGLSRVVTAMAVLKLAEQGKLELTTDVGRYMDDDIRIDGRGRAWAPANWRKTTEFWDRDMTIAQLLANLGGTDTKWAGVRPEEWKGTDMAKKGRELAAQKAEQEQLDAEAKTARQRELAQKKQLAEIKQQKAGGKKKKVRRKRKDASKYKPKVEEEEEDLDIEGAPHEVGTSFVDDGLPSAGDRLVEYFPRCIYPPGQVHTEPAWGYALLGHIVEQVSGLSLWQFAAHNIFAPLRMQATTLSGPGFMNPGPDPDGLAKEEAAIAARQAEKLRKRKEQMEIDKARAEAIRKADEAKRWHDKMAQKHGDSPGKGQSMFGEMVETRRRYEEVAKTEARDRQWDTDVAWEKQMDAERARQRAYERDRAAVAVREGRGVEKPDGWEGQWPPRLWHGFRAWPGFRLTATLQGVRKPKNGLEQLVLNRSPRSPIPVLAPALSLLTTGRDMGRLLICLTGAGSYKGQRVLEESTVRASQAQFSSPHPALGGATLGGFAEFRDGVNNALVCDGADPATGASSSMVLLPEHGVGLFVSFNCCSGHGMHRIQPTLTQRFLDHFYTVPHAPQEQTSLDAGTAPPPPTASLENGESPVQQIMPAVSQLSVPQQVAALFAEHQLDLYSAFAPLDPDGDGRISREALGTGLRRLLPTIAEVHVEYLAAKFPAQDAGQAGDDEDDGFGVEDEDEGQGAVDYRALSNAYGKSWVASMAPRLQAAEHLALQASYYAKRKFGKRPYVGHYASTRTPVCRLIFLFFLLRSPA